MPASKNLHRSHAAQCQSASKTDPGSASKIDPPICDSRRREHSPLQSWSGLRSRGERGSVRRWRRWLSMLSEAGPRMCVEKGLL
jgi:hypothetical protein